MAWGKGGILGGQSSTCKGPEVGWDGFGKLEEQKYVPAAEARWAQAYMV